jgi:hypothetical protein
MLDVSARLEKLVVLLKADIEILTLDQSGAIRVVGHHQTCSYPYKVQIKGGLAFAMGREYLDIADISNPAAPRRVSCVPAQTLTGEVLHVSEHGVYVGDYLVGMNSLDIRDPTKPVVLGGWNPGAKAVAVAARGNRAYLLEQYEGMRIFDAKDGRELTPVGFWQNSRKPQFFGQRESLNCVAVHEGLAYVGGTFEGVYVIDVAKPSTPVLIENFNPGYGTRMIRVVGNRVYVLGYKTFSVWQRTGAIHALVGRADAAADDEYFSFDLQAERALIAAKNGLHIVESINSARPQRVSTFTEFEGTLGVKTAGNVAIVAGKLSMGDRTSLMSVDFTDGNRVRDLGFLQLHGYYWEAANMDVAGTRAFIANDVGGVEIVEFGDPGRMEWIDVLGEFNPSGNSLVAQDVCVRNGMVLVAAADKGLLLYPDRWSGAPVVFRQPKSTTALPGQDVSLNVDAQGSHPLKFRWFKDGLPLAKSERWAGEDSATLTIHDVKADLGGTYHALLSNDLGEASSDRVELSVGARAALEIKLLVTPTEVSIRWGTDPGPQYFLEMSVDLERWQALGTFAGTGGVVMTRVPVLPGPGFFRVVRK